jgi:DNA primase
MINELLVNLANKVLGNGKRTARGNQAHSCPYCNHRKPKLEINFSENKKGYNPWHCWACNKKGSRISILFKQVKATPEQFKALFDLIGKETERKKEAVEYKELKLPKEFQTFDNITKSNIEGRRALHYLKSRGITKDDIIKYNIGYCSYGSYKNNIIIPSYDHSGKLNFFTGRSFEKDPYTKYTNPETSRDIIPFELFINWELPLVLCEGPFDAIAIKRNVIPLMGNSITESLMKQLVTSKVQKIYIALDNDALKLAIKHAEYLMNQSKEIYLVDLDDKDPSEMGFTQFTNKIQNTFPLNEYTLMEKKLSLI